MICSIKKKYNLFKEQNKFINSEYYTVYILKLKFERNLSPNRGIKYFRLVNYSHW